MQLQQIGVVRRLLGELGDDLVDTVSVSSGAKNQVARGEVP